MNFCVLCALFEQIPFGMNRNILKNPTLCRAKNSNKLHVPSHLVMWIPTLFMLTAKPYLHWSFCVFSVGDYVMVEPIDEGDKVKAEIVTILYKEQIKYIKEEGKWYVPWLLQRFTHRVQRITVKFSANNILKYFSFFFSKNKIWHYMQIVSSGDNLHEISNLFFFCEKKIWPSCRLLNQPREW